MLVLHYERIFVMKKMIGILYCVISFASLHGMMDESKDTHSPNGNQSDNTYALYDAIYSGDKETVKQLSHTTYRRSLSQRDIDHAGSDMEKVDMMSTACGLNLSP